MKQGAYVATMVLLLAMPVVVHTQNLAPTYRPLPTARNDSLRNKVKEVDLRLQTIAGQLANAVMALKGVANTATFVATKLQDSIRFAGQANNASNAYSRDSVLRDSKIDISAAKRVEEDRLRVLAVALGDTLKFGVVGTDSVRLETERTIRIQEAERLAAEQSNELQQVTSLENRMRDSSQAILRHRHAAATAGTDALLLAKHGSFDRTPFVRDSMQLSATIDTLSRERRSLETSLDEIKRIASKTFLPVTSKATAEKFFGRSGFDIGRNILLSGGLDGRAATVFTEIGTTYLSGLRLGFGVLVADAKDEKSEAADSATRNSPSNGGDRASVERFLAGGGNFNVTAVWPVLFLKDHAQKHTLTLQLGSRGAFNLTGVDGATTLANPVGDAGLDIYGTVVSNWPYFLRGGCASGSANFIRSTTGRTGRHGFCYAQLTTGGDIPGVGRLVLSWSAGPAALRRPLTLSIQPTISR